MKKYPIPALSLLHTFEAVARRQSFTAAADELCITQSAVSRQIKTLELNLSKKLFVRKHRSIELSPEGRQLFDGVTRGLDEIVGCIKELRLASEAQQITVATSMAFAYFWLMPRLGGLKRFDLNLRHVRQP